MPNQNYQTMLGFDFGTKRIGIAVGQIITMSASPINTVANKDGTPDWSEIEATITEWRPQALIVGVPLNMDGTEQQISRLAREFATQLEEKFGLPIYLIDERLSTKEARAQIFEDGGSKALRKSEIDSYAAKLILETWMNEYFTL